MNKTNLILISLTICIIGLYIQQINLNSNLRTEFQECQTFCEKYKNSCDNTINTYKSAINEYKKNNSFLRANLSEIRTNFFNFRKRYNRLSEKYSELKNQNLNLKSQKGLINPTYEQLWDFILEDKTNNLEWEENFDCTEFSNHFIKNFAKEGFFSCTTEITFEDDGGHIIVAVNTSDRGLFYVEPQSDRIIPRDKLEVGEDYCDIVNWRCDWEDTIKKISSCFKLKND